MNLWEQVLARVETKVNRHSFYTWFKPTSFVGEDRSTVTVRVPNALFKDWLTKHYSGGHHRGDDRGETLGPGGQFRRLIRSRTRP